MAQDVGVPLALAWTGTERQLAAESRLKGADHRVGQSRNDGGPSEEMVLVVGTHSEGYYVTLDVKPFPTPCVITAR